MWNMVYLITGAIFIILLAAVFFSKVMMNTKENKLFKMIIISNIVGYVIEIPLQILVRTYGVDGALIDILCRLYMISISVNYTVFTIYVFVICLNKDREDYNKKIKKISRILQILEILVAISLLMMPFNKYSDTSKMYIYGIALDFLKFCIVCHIGVYFVLLFKNFKKIKDKKYMPIYIIIILLVFMTILNSIDPSILITNMIVTFICYTMSFTIENPDLKLVTELANNRRLTESNLEEKSNMLFQVSQEVKSPLMEITSLSSEIYKSKDNNEIREKAFKIENISRDVVGVINNVLDISQMDTQNIKITKNTYDIYKLLKEVIYVTKNKYRDEGKNIDFKYSISNTIPTSLHGDSLKLKQIICSILFNAFANTDDGYIDLDVTQMIKYNLCRLIITISDSGKGISYEEINNILNDSKEIDEKDLAKINNLDMDLKLTKKVIDLLGGSLLLKSEENRGTTFTIILNQQIASVNDEISSLVETLSNKKRVLLIDDDYLELDKYSYELKMNNLEVVSTMYGHDCIEKLANKEKFDLILVDDELEGFNALDILKEIQKMKIKNQNVVIMLDEKKEFMKHKFLEDYPFADYLLKDDYKSEIERLKNKYL